MNRLFNFCITNELGNKMYATNDEKLAEKKLNDLMQHCSGYYSLWDNDHIYPTAEGGESCLEQLALKVNKRTFV